MFGSCTQVGLVYPCDPSGPGVGGIESFIRGLIKFAPEDIRYRVFGMSLDAVARPPGRVSEQFVDRVPFDFAPLIANSRPGIQSRLPETVRYELAAPLRLRGLRDCDVLESHRIEHFIPPGRRVRPFNLFLHQNMEVIHNPQSDIRWRHAPGLYQALERRVLQAAGSVFVVREDAVHAYRERYPHMAEKFQFLPTWTDPDTFHALDEVTTAEARAALRTRLGLQAEARVLVTVGRIDRQKDPLFLVRGLAALRATHPDVHLAWVGDGALRPQAEALVRELGLAGSVHFLGLQPAPTVARLLHGADVFVLSSAYEGMPIALSEALACGLPSVSTDVGEVRRLIHPGSNGQMCRHGDVEGLAAALGWTLDHAAALRGEPCTRAVLPFHPGTVLAPVHQAYRRLAGRG